MTLEQLEARQFLSVTAHQHFRDLIIQGTGNPDHITLEFTPSEVNGSTVATVGSNGKIIWALARGNNALIPYPKRFVILGGGGSDHLTVSGERADARILIRGGLGNDRVRLSSHNGFPARIYGNEGNDTISVLGELNPGGDSFNSSEWKYLLNVHGNAGDDLISYVVHYFDPHAHRGQARLFGDAGNDRIIGGDGFDHLQGGGGDDTLFGLGGADLLIGGKGHDHIMGGPGDNVIHHGSPRWSLRM